VSVTGGYGGAGHPAPYRFYVSVDASKQGSFKGTSGPSKDGIPVIGYSFDFVSAPSTATGSAQTHATRSSVVVTKEWDATSPKFYQATLDREVLKSVKFEFVKPSPEGKEEAWYKITLTNATILEYKQYTGLLPDGGTNTFELEDMTFTFQKIEVQDVESGTSATHDAATSRKSVATAPGGGSPPPNTRPTTSTQLSIGESAAGGSGFGVMKW
jgi:type VI secretion system Hcp family effector